MPPVPEKTPKNPGTPSVPTGNPQGDPAEPAVTDSKEHFIEQAMADYESPLLGYASSILNNLDRARDVVQDTFIRLCQQDIPKVSANLKSWLFTVCRNRALDQLRKDKHIQPIDDIQWQRIAGPELQPDQQTEHDETFAMVMKFLDRLSANQREVILLKFQQGLSYQEITAITGLSSGNIGFLIHTGLKRLRELLPSDLRR